MFTTSLAIQSTYQSVQCALFHNNDLIECITLDKRVASKKLIPTISDLFYTHDLSLHDISFMSVNLGPAPFTTLRVVIATANGISFASDIPLIGIDGLQAIMLENKSTDHIPAVLLLDAFNKDVYFALRNKDHKIKKGCQKINNLLQELYEHFPKDEPVRFLGNGAQLYKKEIEEVFKDRAVVSSDSVDACSIDQIGLLGWESWQNKNNLSKKLLPLYLKNQMLK